MAQKWSLNVDFPEPKCRSWIDDALILACGLGGLQVYAGSGEWRAAAEAAAEVVWKRGLLRRVGLCHGISGNAYAFLALHRVVAGDKRQLFRARQFAGWVHKHGKRLLATGEMHGGDHRHSLFEGLGGLAYLWFDVARPDLSFFPGYQIN